MLKFEENPKKVWGNNKSLYLSTIKQTQIVRDMKRTEYMAASDLMKERVISEMTSRKEEASKIRSVLSLINSFDIACFRNVGFGVKFYNWLTNEEFSTAYLREISACVGYDYWDELDAMAAIDELDTISAKYGKIK